MNRHISKPKNQTIKLKHKGTELFLVSPRDAAQGGSVPVPHAPRLPHRLRGGQRGSGRHSRTDAPPWDGARAGRRRLRCHPCSLCRGQGCAAPAAAAATGRLQLPGTAGCCRPPLLLLLLLLVMRLVLVLLLLVVVMGWAAVAGPVEPWSTDAIAMRGVRRGSSVLLRSCRARRRGLLLTHLLPQTLNRLRQLQRLLLLLLLSLLLFILIIF
jgi:hypothetical protein